MYGTDVQLGLHVGPLSAGAGLSDSTACLWSPFPYWAALSSLNSRRYYYYKLLQQSGLISMGDLLFSEDKGRGHGGGEVKHWDWGEERGSFHWDVK